MQQAYAELTDEDRVSNLDYISRSNRDETAVPLDIGDFTVENGRFEGDFTPLVDRLAAAYMRQIDERREVEIIRGVNLVGAHRDDFETSLDSLPVKGFASHGEMWSMALTLRLAEAEVLRQQKDYPILILDDVFAELDRGRRRGLVERIARAEQAIITVAVPEDIPPELHSHFFDVFRAADRSTEIRPLEPKLQAARDTAQNDESEEPVSGKPAAGDGLDRQKELEPNGEITND